MYTLKLTSSQRMALLDITSYYVRQEKEPQVFIDCSTSPAEETASGEILQLVMDAKYDRD